jgi:hypothetical protein
VCSLDRQRDRDARLRQGRLAIDPSGRRHELTVIASESRCMYADGPKTDVRERRRGDKPSRSPAARVGSRIGQNQERVARGRDVVGDACGDRIGLRCRRVLELRRADQRLVEGGHAGDEVQHTLVDAERGLADAGTVVEVDERPVAERPERRDRIPVRRGQQREGERKGDAHTLVR